MGKVGAVLVLAGSIPAAPTHRATDKVCQSFFFRGQKTDSKILCRSAAYVGRSIYVDFENLFSDLIYISATQTYGQIFKKIRKIRLKISFLEIYFRHDFFMLEIYGL